METYNMYELKGIHKCKMRRGREIHVGKVTDSHVQQRNALIKSIIERLLMGKMNGQQASDAIDVFFEENNDFAAKKTRDIFANEMKRCINRYLSSEKRRPMFPAPCEIEVGGLMKVFVKPDFAFIDNKTIEVVIMRYSKPKITQNGHKADFSANNSLEMYSLLCYARLLAKQCATQYNLPKTAVVKASIYYLRKANDSDKKGTFDSDFFDITGKNVVTLCDYHVFDGAPNDVDENYIPQVKSFLQGEEIVCNEEKCGNCEFFKICSFKKSPMMIEKEKKVKSLAALKLTKPQQEAIAFSKGIARINAGAGAGKTLTVALRTVTLLNSGVKPSEIVLLTFTTTGAEEMRERIEAYNAEFGSGCDISDMHIQTFNAFQDEIIHKEWQALGFHKEPRLIDDVERSAIIVDILKDKDIPGIDFRNFYMNTKDVQGALVVTKKIFNVMKTYNLGDEDEDLTEIARHLGMLGKFLPINAIEQIANLYNEYTARLNDDALIEFADQEILTFQLFYTVPDYFEKLGIKHIIVDEFQDSNEGQMDFIKMIIDTPNFESLMVVGDDSQAIFGFRDTSPKYIIDFYDILKRQGTDFFLLENHRSTPEIIDFANKLNDLNTCKVQKNLIATRGHGKKPIALGFVSREQEYGYIVEQIEKRIANGVKPENIAFIASTKTELLTMASLLTEKKIPSVLLNPEPFMDNSKVLAALDMIRFLKNTSSTEYQLNWLNCLSRNTLLQKSDSEIKQVMAKTKMEVEFMMQQKDPQRLRTIFAMLDMLNDSDEVYEKFLETLKYRSSTKALIQYCEDFILYGAECGAKRQHDYPGVVLTTAHSSKGLEWSVVFNSITKYDSPEIRRKNTLLEEKRRLFFVSSTRARDELIITAQYVAFGAKDDRTYNRFLQEAYQLLNQSFQPQQAFMQAVLMAKQTKTAKKTAS